MTSEIFSTAEARTTSSQGWVLVLVREQRLRQLLLKALNVAGYALLGCATVAEAAQVLGRRSAPRVILFDGAEANEEKLRENIHQIEAALPSGSSCRLIVFSLTHPQPRLQALPGVDTLIARPFDLSQVLDEVEALMHD